MSPWESAQVGIDDWYLHRQQNSWGQHAVHLGPVGPIWAPCWSHEPCYQGSFQSGTFYLGIPHLNHPLTCWIVEDQIHNGTALHIAYPILTIPCLQLLWRLKEPGHQPGCYWPSQPEYFIFSIRRYCKLTRVRGYSDNNPNCWPLGNMAFTTDAYLISHFE